MTQKAFATLPLSNFGGIEVLAIDPVEETMTWRYNYGKPETSQTADLLFDDVSGNPFVILDNNRYELSDFLLTNI